MSKPEEGTARVFKTAPFSKVAKKALIKDDQLCTAIAEVLKGQCDDLGGEGSGLSTTTSSRDFESWPRRMAQSQISSLKLLADKDLTEICNGDKAKV
jgi:hypothetical protein